MGSEAGLTIEIAERSDASVAHVRVSGASGALSCETLERLIRRQITLGARRVVLDATDLERIDPEFAATLARVGHAVDLEIDAPSEDVQRALAAVGFVTRHTTT